MQPGGHRDPVVPDLDPRGHLVSLKRSVSASVDACSVPISAARSIYRQLMGLHDGNCSLSVIIYLYNRDPSLSDAFVAPSFSCSLLL